MEKKTNSDKKTTIPKKDQVLSNVIWKIVYEATLSKAPTQSEIIKKYLQHPRYRNIGKKIVNIRKSRKHLCQSLSDSIQIFDNNVTVLNFF